jgi:Ca2+-binding RTX toxin-like protein
MAVFTFVGNENASNGTSLNVIQGIDNVISASAYTDGFDGSRLVAFGASDTDGSGRTATFAVATDGSNQAWWTGITVASPIAGGGSATVLTGAGFNSAIPVTHSNIFSPENDAVVIDLLANMFAGSDRFDVSGQVSSIWGDYQTAPSSPPAVLGNDIIVIAGSTTVASGSTRVTIYGDALQFITGATVTAGNDIIEGTAATVGLTLYGDFASVSGTVTYGNDSLFGGNQADTIYGDSASSTAAGGNDVLMGNGGDDVLFGGGGNDRLNGGIGADALDGGAGFDVAWYTLSINIDDTGIVDLLDLGANTEDAAGDTFIGIEGIRGRDFDFGGADDLRGDNLANSLWGMAGNDHLNGRGGNDLLDGGAGTDTMIGGTGKDIYIVAAAGDTTIENAGEGTDTVRSYIDWVLANNVERLELQGVGNLNGAGNALNNTLVGNAGNNLLNGGAGNDYMVGGAGNDTFIVAAAGDATTENAGEGTDTVRSYINWTLRANIERLELQGSSNLNGTGNTLANTLVGNSGANILSGGAGNDYIVGGSGNDRLIGGAGRDTLIGGTGNDTFDFNLVSESPAGAASRDTISGGFAHGFDLIDLATIDANTLAAGNQACSFIGSAAFSGVAGQLRYSTSGGNVIIDADVNGDSAADMQMLVAGTNFMTGTDFIL